MEPGSSGSHNHGKSKTRKNKNFKCFKCDKSGHFRKDCRGLNSSYPQGNVASTSEDGNALCCEAAVANESRKRFADVWLFDTRATFYMTARREWFHEYKPISGGGSVYSCNDHELKIIGIGSIIVKMHDGTVRTIRDVRHVEGLKKNLLSLGQLDDLVCKVEIQNKIMKIIKGALVLMKEEKVAANLYQLKEEIMEEAEASVASHCPSHRVAVSWHQKLGHMSEQGMKILVERKLITGLIKVSLPFCEYCVISKRHRLKFKTSNSRSVYARRNQKAVHNIIHSSTEWSGRAVLNTACYVINCSPSTAVELKIPMEMWTGKPVNYSDLHIFGSPVYVMYNTQETTKLDPKSRKCLFLGYAEGIEKEFQSNDSSEVVPQHEVNETDESQALVTRTFNRERKRIGWQADYVMESNIAYCLLTEEGEPSTLQEALNNPYALFWKEAIQEEIESLDKNKTWELVPLPGGYAQKEGIDFNEIFSPVVRMTTIRVVLEMCATSLEYNRLHADPCAYFKRFGNNDFIILLLYVDGMLVAGPNKDRVNKLKAQLAREFKMKDLGLANKILGMQIHRDRVSRKFWLSQKSYVKKILQRFNMQDCKPISTPFPTDVKLSSKISPCSEKERMEMSRVPYASAMGSLIFAMICTRPDIAHAVGVVSRYMAKPGRQHWEAVKRILRYIKGTSDVALCFGDSDLIVKGCVDSDYACDLDGSKSTTGYVFTLSDGTVSWVSKLHALYLARNPAFHLKTKHIRVQYHFVREKVEEGTVDMAKIHTDDNVADYLTKAINGDKFIWCRSSYGLTKT
ncbi:retrovirus-related pol polyprotein from transposon TNT 1-94 [Tanacetum coccineum]|uniref:Retrovirus-related pol polyprotein from transposon TNT 1-94 n=1 Tax=Tanacetum coccineum TaxID=301880 RepID=A0ABQ5J466_9ASTR